VNIVRKAFTLIELLVVVAIIAILVAILMPVFAQAKVTAKQTVCLSNMQQIGKALMLYLQDNDDRWCAASIYAPLTGFANQQMWIGYDNRNYGLDGGFWGHVYERQRFPVRPGAIDPYIQDEGVKKCPAMPKDWQMSYAANWFNEAFYSPYYSVNPAAYGNEYGPSVRKFFYAPDGSYSAVGAAYSEIDAPSQTLAMWEHLARVPLCNFLQQANWLNSPPNDPYLRNHFHFLHRKAAIALWVDGHAKRIIYDRLQRPWFSCQKSFYVGWL